MSKTHVSRSKVVMIGLAFVAVGCNAPVVRNGGGEGARPGAPPAVHLPDSGPAVGGGSTTGGPIGGATGVPSDSERCATSSHRAMPVPVDLMFLVDKSGSMNDPSGNSTKWRMMQDALTRFVNDSSSAGMGIAMSFFPQQPMLGGNCTSDDECGAAPGRPEGTYCRVVTVCSNAGSNTFTSVCGGPRGNGCGGGPQCIPLGKCETSGRDCVPVGGACSGAEGMCIAKGKTCDPEGGAPSSCAVTDYETATVPFGDLTGAAGGVVGAISAQTPNGSTPTAAAVTGVLNFIRRHQSMAPQRRTVLILATDGVPTRCAGNTVADIADHLQIAGRSANPISTYVIGVFGMADQAMGGPDAANRWAVAGNTGRPFVLVPGDDLSMKLQEAFNQIRGNVLACDFAIPSNVAIDFRQVNVRFTSSAGSQELSHVGSRDRCEPLRGGWYYDVDPATGTPTRVLTCAASCEMFKTARDPTVELVFGCKTRVIE